MLDEELKSKSAIDNTGGGVSDIGEVAGVAIPLEELESEESRIRFEDGDGGSSSDDDDDATEIFDAAGVIPRCAMLVLFGTRLGSGAIFLREDDFSFRDVTCSDLGGGIGTSAIGAGVGSGGASGRFLDGGTGTLGGASIQKRRGTYFGPMQAAKGAASGFVVMAMVAAERSGFGGGVEVLFGFEGF